MAYPWLLAEYKRRKRIRHPEPTVVMLVQIMGVEWWIRHGFYREYRVGRWYIDLCNPKIALAVEGDGARYHMDIVREQQRDEDLHRRGYHVLHFRYDKLLNRPSEVRREIQAAYEMLRLPTARERLLIEAQMKRSGF